MKYLSKELNTKAYRIKEAKEIINRFTNGESVRKIEILYAINQINTKTPDNDTIINHIKSIGKGPEFEIMLNQIYDEMKDKDKKSKGLESMMNQAIHLKNFRLHEDRDIPLTDE